jgi:hypothetical protein
LWMGFMDKVDATECPRKVPTTEFRFSLRIFLTVKIKKKLDER